MSKKIMILVSVVLVISLATVGVALAANASSNPGAVDPQTQFVNLVDTSQAIRQQGIRMGQITAIGDHQLTVKIASGTKTVIVDDQTKYYNQAGQPLTFQDLQIGVWVIGKYTRNNNQILAKSIVVLPQGFNPSAINDRLRGTIVAIDQNSGAVTLRGPGGEEQAVILNQATTFLGKVQSLSDVKVGMAASVGAAKQSDGSLQAVIIFAHQRLLWHIGSVTAIDEKADTFTLKTLANGDLIFKVDANTKFISKNHQIKGLADLKTGLAAIVVAHQNADGSLTADRVAAGSKAAIQKWVQKGIP